MSHDSEASCLNQRTRVCSFLSELIESAMYLFRATGDHTYLQLGLDALESIERIAKTPCGYATVRCL